MRNFLKTVLAITMFAGLTLPVGAQDLNAVKNRMAARLAAVDALKAALSPSVAAAVRTSSARTVAADIPDLDGAAAEWPKLSVAKAEWRSAARAASGPVKTVRAASAVPSRRLAGAASTSVSRVVDGAAGRIRSAQRTATPAENTTRPGGSSGAQPI